MPNSFYSMQTDKTSKIISIAFLVFVLLNFPILGLFGKPYFLFGIPLLYLYIFIVWIIMIIFLAFMMRDKRKI